MSPYKCEVYVYMCNTDTASHVLCLSCECHMLCVVCNDYHVSVTCWCSDYHKELGGLWLQSSGMARRTGLLETAGNSLRMAEVHALPELYLERARLLYAKVRSVGEEVGVVSLFGC